MAPCLSACWKVTSIFLHLENPLCRPIPCLFWVLIWWFIAACEVQARQWTLCSVLAGRSRLARPPAPQASIKCMVWISGCFLVLLGRFFETGMICIVRPVRFSAENSSVFIASIRLSDALMKVGLQARSPAWWVLPPCLCTSLMSWHVYLTGYFKSQLLWLQNKSKS